MLDFKVANAKLSVKINRALLLLIEQEKERLRMYFIHLFISNKNYVSAKNLFREGFGRC